LTAPRREPVDIKLIASTRWSTAKSPSNSIPMFRRVPMNSWTPLSRSPLSRTGASIYGDSVAGGGSIR
jgi:hypothetical protein